jgi:hypothetical protein
LQCIDFRQPFPWDQLVAHNPLAIDLIYQVQQGFACEMSEWQGSWAVNALIRWGMRDHGAKTGVQLQPRE